ncbi:MAG TPA: hypothetical protein VL027_02075 [Spongiibacteraceae bacterium]|jgi:WD40 repeat protein|nr:hypothetical protein [Spongiibacteraceae bacterium]HUH36711.1 hypothetical protein [Spongiibacteraceae bacterium]
MSQRPWLVPAVLATVLLSGCDSYEVPSASWEYAVQGLHSGCLSSDGSLAVVGSIAHGGSLWRVDTQARAFDWNHRAGEQSTLVACGFSPDARFALTADPQTLVLWDTASGSALRFWSSPAEVLGLALTPAANYALLGLANFSAVLFDVKNGGIQRIFQHQDRVRSVALSADGQLALTGAEDRSARLWNLQSGELLQRWDHDREVTVVALSDDGNRALSVAKYDKAVIWDTRTGAAVWELPLGASAVKRGETFTSARFSSDGQQLLTGDNERRVRLWSVTDKTLLASWQVPKRDPWKPTGASILALAFTPEPQRYIALASNGYAHRLSLPAR